MKLFVKHIFTLLLLFCSTFLTMAQHKDYFDGELLVKLEQNVDIIKFTDDFQHFQGKSIRLMPIKRLANSINLWHLHFEHIGVDEQALLRAVQYHPSVQIAQFNHTNVELRAAPNDPQYGDQWDMDNTGQSGGTPDADIDAPEAWDISTGGTTTQGDDIVVAVVDGSFDIAHEDLVPNLWVNTDEIPGNGVDDDNNGYIDDINGWNAYNNNGTITSGSHGTHVAGTVGAKGNNGIGVTGVNWDVKIMCIQGSSGNEATVVAAYGFILDERTLYNNTNGAEGSFVVSTNASFGVDNGNPANFPLWCGMYDDLGAQGILSCGATANANNDIDAVGDIPTACPSDFMIAVTNTTDTDAKNNGAAYGATTIDLGAPGTSILSTLPGDTYGNLTGTSMATPHVAGAIGLLYAAACDNIITDHKTNPQTSALDFRTWLLDGTDPIAALNGITVTGGRLNVYNSILEMNPGPNGTCTADYTLATNPTSLSICQGDIATIDIDITALLGYTGTVNLSVGGEPAGSTATLSNSTVTPTGTTTETLTINGTGAVTGGTYTITITGNDGASIKTATVDLTIIDTSAFATTNLAPDGTTGESVAPNLTWDAVAGASSYDVEIYSDAGFSSLVMSMNVATNSYTLGTPLNTFTMYYWRVRPNGSCGAGNYETASFETGSVEYCPSNSTNNTEEWIESVVVGSINNVSGADAGGYADYTALSTTMDIGGTYTIDLTPGYPGGGTAYNEWWVVWIDYNVDGDFDDAGEEVFNSGSANNTPVSGSITIPAAANATTTTMRVSMQYNAAATSCEVFTWGEVEDYTVIINNPTGCGTNMNITTDYSSLDGVVDWESSNWIVATNIIMNGANVTYDATTEVILNPGFEAIAGCEFLGTIDGCGGALKTNENKTEFIENNLISYPNPFSDITNIELTVIEATNVNVEVIDIMGKKVVNLFSGNIEKGTYQYQFNGENLPTGTYFCRMITDSEQKMIKLMLVK